MSADHNTFTKRLLQDAGISPGMRVLDLGCGTGEVSLLLARLVEPFGEVVGVDRDATALALAQQRAQEHYYSHLSFVLAQLDAVPFELGVFDAIVGRRVLMYLPKPAEIIRQLTTFLRPNGLMIFQESDSTMVPARLKTLPLHDQVLGWMWQTVEHEGANIQIGFQLHAILQAAGLSVEHLRAEPVIQGQNTHYPLAFVIQAMLPRIIQSGVATETEIDIATLEQRLNAERPANVVYISDMSFGIWGRKTVE